MATNDRASFTFDRRVAANHRRARTLNTETGARIPLTLQAGDKVLFTSSAGTEIKIEGVDLLILVEADILAVVD